MNEELQRQLIAQLKVLNFWVRFFGGLVIITLLILGYLIFRVVSFVQDTNDKIDNFQSGISESVDLKSRVCESDNSFTDVIKSQTSACEE